MKKEKLVRKRQITGAKNYLYIVEPHVEINNENDVWEGSLKHVKNSFIKILKEGHNKLETKLTANRKKNEDELKNIKDNMQKLEVKILNGLEKMTNEMKAKDELREAEMKEKDAQRTALEEERKQQTQLLSDMRNEMREIKQRLPQPAQMPPADQ